MKYKATPTVPYSQLPQHVKDSLNNLPKTSYTSYNINQLISEGVLRSESDLAKQIQQDILFNKGIYVDVIALDTIYRRLIDRDYEYRITNLDSLGNVISCSQENNDTKYNICLDTKIIGVNKTQNLKTEINIPLTSFFKISIFSVTLSLLILLLTICALLYLLVKLRSLEHNLKAKEANINGVIHDLRLPVSNMVLALEIVNPLIKEEYAKDIIYKTNISIRYLSNKLESLLVATRSKEVELRANKVNINPDMLNERLTNIKLALCYRYTNKKSSINLTNLVEREVNLDLMFIESILANLLENSLKYSNDEVIIDINICLKGENTLVMDVKDNGLGIGSKNHKSIFEQYFRVDEKYKNGTGIGLNYSRILAKLHGGNLILISSCLGVGSHFRATLNIE
ncbi:MAG: HAMP domain-containing sensor histidine kinase [Rikenellaceae bacterium]